MPDVKTEITAEWCRETAAAYEQWAGGDQHEAKLAAALRIAERVLEEGAVNRMIGDAIVNFRAKSATTQYESGHALQPSDCVRLKFEISQAIIDYLKGGGDDPR